MPDGFDTGNILHMFWFLIALMVVFFGGSLLMDEVRDSYRRNRDARLARDARPIRNWRRSALETYNDIDRDVCRFFRTLRDHRTELVEALTLTLYARGEFELACEPLTGLSDVERARHYMVRPWRALGMSENASAADWRYEVAYPPGKARRPSGRALGRLRTCVSTLNGCGVCR